MRARELYEDYNQSLQSDLSDILLNAKGSGASQVQTAQVAQQLQGMGYAVTPESLTMLLSGIPGVSNATPEMITLSSEQPGEGAGNTQDSASQVSDMAQSATDL